MATTKQHIKLTAVNTIISNIGQAPVTGLETGNPLVEMAEQILLEISRAVQAEGWDFNTEFCYPFKVDASGEIAIPDNVLALDSAPRSAIQAVVRDGKLYDKFEHTYTFTNTQHLDVIWNFDFEDLPEAFRNYITIRAANVFAGRSVGTSEAVRFGEREELLARATAMEYDTQQGDYTIFSDRDNRVTYDSYRPIDPLVRTTRNY
jgi:hypothetical protein